MRNPVRYVPFFGANMTQTSQLSATRPAASTISISSEVRSLAQRSAGAAKEIKALIHNSVDRVSNGTALVDQAGVTMAEIVEAVKRVTDIMGEISAASEEQSSGIEQVNQAVNQMDQVTQQNAARVEQAAAAAEALEEQARILNEAVGSFRLSH